MGKGGKRRKPGARRKSRVFIGVWVPGSVAMAVDAAVRALELDRSTFLRQAIEERISKEDC
jgi:hypothetical protein